MEHKKEQTLDAVLRRSKLQLNRDIASALSEREHRVACVLRELRQLEEERSMFVRLAALLSPFASGKRFAPAAVVLLLFVFSLSRFDTQQRIEPAQLIAKSTELREPSQSQSQPRQSTQTELSADTRAPLVVSIDGFDGTPEFSEVSVPLVLLDDGAYEQDDMEYAWTSEHMALDPSDVQVSLELSYEDIETEA